MPIFLAEALKIHLQTPVLPLMVFHEKYSCVRLPTSRSANSVIFCITYMLGSLMSYQFPRPFPFVLRLGLGVSLGSVHLT